MTRRMVSQLCAGLLALSLTGCGAGGPELGEVFEGTVNDYEGVTMSVVEGTAAPGQVNVEVVNDTGLDVYSSAADEFGLQAEKDGQWRWLERQDPGTETDAFASKAVVLAPGASQEFICAWNDSYGTLKPGRYRVTNRVFVNPVPGEDSVHFLLAAEFTLE